MKIHRYALTTLAFTALFTAIFFQNHLAAQVAAPSPLKRELGMRLSGFNDFDFIYKKELAPEKYRRYRLGFADLEFSTLGQFQSYGFSAGVAIGSERRRGLTEDLKFIHGAEWLINFGISGQESSVDLTLGSGLGVVLGFQYEVSEKFSASLEAVPSLLATYRATDGAAPDYFEIGARFDVNAVALSLVYKFVK